MKRRNNKYYGEYLRTITKEHTQPFYYENRLCCVVFANKLEYLLHNTISTYKNPNWCMPPLTYMNCSFSYKQTAQSDKYQNLKYLQHLYGSVQERIKLQLPTIHCFSYTIMCINMVLYYTELQINERLTDTHLLCITTTARNL